MKRPYHLFLFNAMLLAVAGFFCQHRQADLHIHDTYIIFPLALYMWLPAIFLFVMWLLYRATEQVLYSRKLTWIHILLTVFTEVLIYTLPLIIHSSYGAIASDVLLFDFDDFNLFPGAYSINVMVKILFLVLAAGGQLIFFGNVMLGLYNRFANANH